MSTTVNANPVVQGTPRASHLSATSSAATIVPNWAPPKSPLPPHRLAKLANALGVSTPMLAVHQLAFPSSRSFLESTTPSEIYRRSPTPSTPGSTYVGQSSTISKYLLHVVPPLHLPHDTDDTDMTPPPQNAFGYHTQFRRGTLVPVHSNLQSQLGAIAKEYALPSTAGLILYLVSSAKKPHANHTHETRIQEEDEVDEPGPRLSEDIWKHLWIRVLRTEQHEDMPTTYPPKSHLGMSLGAQSTPFLPHESNGHPLRPLISSPLEVTPSRFANSHFPPSPTTSSTISEFHNNTKSTPPSASSVYDPETPDTSSAAPSLLKDSAARANSLDLPGLTSPSIIPILAKVEFDIDRRRAAWYEPWIRSRRLNHAKRAESRNGVKGNVTDGGENPEGSSDRPRHIDLITGRKTAGIPVTLPLPPEKVTSAAVASELSSNMSVAWGYEQLPESQDGWSDDSDDEEFEPTARVTAVTLAGDPLADVFGADMDTWADLKALSSRESKRQTTSNIVDLVLNAPDLTTLPSPTRSEFQYLGKEEDEVQALLDQMSRPSLAISIPPPPPEKRSSSPAGIKKHVPPPLMLVPTTTSKDLIVPTENSIPSSASSTNLPYLNEPTSEESPAYTEQDGEGAVDADDNFEMDYNRVRSPAESEKRGGAVFDDLDLGLDPTEDYDDDDPHDRRRSQFIMKAQLDEIERTLAQLSPRILQTDLETEQSQYLSSISPNNSMSLSPPGKLNADYYPPSPKLPGYPAERESPESQLRLIWHASHTNTSRDVPPSPPRLTVNGITTSAPKGYVPTRPSGFGVSTETETGERKLEEERGYSKSSVHTDLPVIPLSPDPFSRFTSTPTTADSQPVYWADIPSSAKLLAPSQASMTSQAEEIQSANGRKRSNSSATSRFSADSMTGLETAAKPSNRSTLIGVSLKRFWRKSTKSPSISNPPLTPLNSSFPPARPERPSEELLEEPPKTPLGRLSPQLVVPRRSQDMPPPVPQVPPHSQAPSILQQQKPLPASPNLSQPLPQQTAKPMSQHLTQASASSPHLQQQPTIPIPQQLSVPPPFFTGRNINSQPIVAAQMRPGRSNSTLDRLHFDQESPYPMPRRNPSYSRSGSPPSVSSPQLQTTHPPPTPTVANGNMLPPLDSQIISHEKEKPSIRKSILKGWKSSSISSTVSAQQLPEPRSSLERPSTGGNPRSSNRPSVLNFGSTRGSVVSPPPDIPPSPQIPQQFISRNDNRQSIRSRLTSSSIDSTYSTPHAHQVLSAGSTSPRRSIASSRGSQESRPSLDTSQFEIVSPKTAGSMLTYPYHGLEHS